MERYGELARDGTLSIVGATMKTNDVFQLKTHIP
jgi:hypothetical protein